MSDKSVVVLGAGIAGIEVASNLRSMGLQVHLLEKQHQVGGHLRQWHQLFPDRKLAMELAEAMEMDRCESRTLADVKNISKQERQFRVETSQGDYLADALVLATGYEVFDAGRKEEYGHGIYDHVVSSVELETMFKNGTLLSKLGREPQRVGFVHCVGSRDEKCGGTYCSKVCCATAVKQAIELKEKYPDAEVFCFYMDLRMYDRYLEDLYLEAQEKHGIQFIRGRLSEASEAKDGRIVAKLEDTLASKPLRLTLDLLVLMVGFRPSAQTEALSRMLNVPLGTDGFFQPMDEHHLGNTSAAPGVFLAGSCKGPMGIKESLADARAAALQLALWLKNQ